MRYASTLTILLLGSLICLPADWIPGLVGQETRETGNPADEAVASESDLTEALKLVQQAMADKRAAEREIDAIEQRRQEEERRAAMAQRKLAQDKLAAIERQLAASQQLTTARSRLAAITSQLAVMEQLRDAKLRLADADRRLGNKPGQDNGDDGGGKPAPVTATAENKMGFSLQPLDDEGDIIEKFSDDSWGISLDTGKTFMVKKEPVEITDSPQGKVIVYADGTRERVGADGKRTTLEK